MNSNDYLFLKLVSEILLLVTFCYLMFQRVFFFQYQVVDGPDEEGNMYERPGKVSDIYLSKSFIKTAN